MEEKLIDNDVSTTFTVQGTLVLNGMKFSGVEITSCEGKYLIDSAVLDDLLEKSRKCKILKLSYERMSELWKNYNTPKGKNDAYVAKELIELVKSISLSGDADSIKQKLEELIKAYNSMTIPTDNTEEVMKLRQQLQATEAKLAEAQEPDFRALGKKLSERSIEVRSEKRIKAQAVMLSLAIKGEKPNEIAGVLAERGYGNSLGAISRALSVVKQEDKDRLRGIMNSCPDEFSDVTDDDFEKWYSVKHEKALKSYKKKLLTKRLKEEIEKELSDDVAESTGNDWGE